MAYHVDDTMIFANDSGLPSWARSFVRQKITAIRQVEDPRCLGGCYRGKWAYPVGKLHLIADIDDEKQIVTLLKILKLP